MSRWQRLMPFAALCGALAALFHRLLAGEVIFWGVPLLQFFPWRVMAFDALRAGRLPLWNPLVGNGAPLLANYQTAAFYPPNWLYLILPTEHAMGWVGLLHLLWAGLGMLVLLRRMGVGRLGQGVGALAFALSGYLVARFGFLTIVSAAAWLPWLVWAVDGLVGEGVSARRMAGLAGIAAMLLLAGHAQTAFYSLTLAGAYAVWRAATRGRKAIIGLAVALGAVVLGVALAAVQLAPTLELVIESQRAGGVDYLAALSYSFWPWRFLTFALPDIFGSPASGDYWGYGAYWEDAVYVGLLPLLLAGRALVGWVRVRRSGEVSPPARAAPFYALSLPVIFVLALGWHTPVFPWLFTHVPTFNLFNGPTRWMLLAVFALAVLAGIGADGWRAEQKGTPWAMRGIAVGLAFLLAAALTMILLGEAVNPTLPRAAARLGIALALVGGLAALLPFAERAPRWRLGWEGLALALIAADLVSAHWGLNPTIDAGYYRQRAALADSVPEGTRVVILPADEQAAKFELFLDFADFRAEDRDHWDALRASLLPNLNMVDGMAAASSFDPLLVGNHAVLLASIEGLLDGEQAAALARLNAGILLSPAHRAGLELIGQAGPLYSYMVPDPWPRAALAACTPGEDGLACERLGAGRAAVVVDEPERVVAEIEADRAAWLVLVDTHYPGWQATLDGVPVVIERANGAFRAVRVPEGGHAVAFEYRPRSLRVGVVIGAAGLLAWAGLWGAAYAGRR